jgi:hypothetical protein
MQLSGLSRVLLDLSGLKLIIVYCVMAGARHLMALSIGYCKIVGGIDGEIRGLLKC